MEKRVFIKKCDTYEPVDVYPAITAILEHFGGVEEILKRGKNILIKPNLLMARSPDGATTTHPEIVYAVAKAFADYGANVVIADSPGGAYTSVALKRVYMECGMDRAAQRAGATLNFDVGSRKIEYNGLEKRSFEIINPVFEADTIINIAKFKTHMLTYFTGAVKNLFGTIAGLNKAACHAKIPKAKDFCKLLVDLCNFNGPYINIIDGVDGMDGKGPSGGRVRHVGLISASGNPYALDLAMMYIAGLDWKMSPVYRIAAKEGFVTASPFDLEMCGDSFSPLSEPFVPAKQVDPRVGALDFMPSFIKSWLEQIFMKYPRMTSRCIGCADCARACPKGAITVVGRKAILNKDKCIKCYCCHELCPIKAIDL